VSGRKQRANDGNVHLRSAGQGNTLVFTIPAPMGRTLVGAGLTDSLFHPELTEEGILFRFVGPIPAEPELPKWVQS
jgi:hypothetical protein